MAIPFLEEQQREKVSCAGARRLGFYRLIEKFPVLNLIRDVARGYSRPKFARSLFGSDPGRK